MNESPLAFYNKLWYRVTIGNGSVRTAKPLLSGLNGLVWFGLVQVQVFVNGSVWGFTNSVQSLYKFSSFQFERFESAV